MRVCDDLRSAITTVDHVASLMVLTLHSADVSKLLYHIRINGGVLLIMTYWPRLIASRALP